MQNRIISYTLLLLCLTVLSGCASIWSPYKSDFQCPETDKGKCLPVRDAYRESLQSAGDNQKQPETENKKKEKTESQKPEDDYYNLYQKGLYKELTGLLSEPQTPLVVPPKVMRVLVLPYVAEGGSQELYMLRYVYFFADTPKFILADPATGGK